MIEAAVTAMEDSDDSALTCDGDGRLTPPPPGPLTLDKSYAQPATFLPAAAASLQETGVELTRGASTRDRPDRQRPKEDPWAELEMAKETNSWASVTTASTRKASEMNSAAAEAAATAASLLSPSPREEYPPPKTQEKASTHTFGTQVAQRSRRTLVDDGRPLPKIKTPHTLLCRRRSCARTISKSRQQRNTVYKKQMRKFPPDRATVNDIANLYGMKMALMWRRRLEDISFILAIVGLMLMVVTNELTEGNRRTVEESGECDENGAYCFVSDDIFILVTKSA